MAGSSGASDVSFEMNSDEEFGGFYTRGVELVEEQIRDRPGEFGRATTKLTSPTLKIATSPATMMTRSYLIRMFRRMCMFCHKNASGLNI